MPEDKPSSLEVRLEQAIQAKKPELQVEARCPKCKRLHHVAYIRGMRSIGVGVYRVMCQSCVQITLYVRRADGHDLTGQLFLPGLLDTEH